MNETGFTINRHYAWVLFRNEGGYTDSSNSKLLNSVFDFMRQREFSIGKDPDIVKHYPILSPDHFAGRKGGLRFKAERYPVGWEIKFYQEVNTINRCGGFYDFDKFNLMPYPIRLSFINETERIRTFLKSLNVKDISDPVSALAEDCVKWHYVESWHKPQKDMNFNLADLDGQTSGIHYYDTDRDIKTIHNGEIKYFRDHSGHLSRGKVYHNINNMWWVILNKYEYTNVVSFHLFDPTAADFAKRREKKDSQKIPELVATK